MDQAPKAEPARAAATLDELLAGVTAASEQVRA